MFQREADRLDLQHHVLCLTFNSKLYFSPIEKPKNVLDVGTGTGIWAIDMGMCLSAFHKIRHVLIDHTADQHPECQVTGIDLSPGQPTL